jgi:hypothetical protein
MIPLVLNIAGEIFPVQFNGFAVFDTCGNMIEYIHADCGMEITQEMLVKTCKNKISKN